MRVENSAHGLRQRIGPANPGSTRFSARGYRARMFRRVRLSALLVLTACVSAAAADSPQSLTEDQIREAQFLESLSIPTPGELFAAFGKIGKPDWAAFFRKQPPAPHTSRPLIALNLGARIADGFLAAEAQDRQQAKNVSTEIKLLAKSLGLEQEFMVRSNSIAGFADSRRWDALDEELEAVQAELAAAMAGRRDAELATLMSLGCWLRAVDIAGAQLAANYTPQAARILRQPAVAESFAARLDALPAKIKTLPAVAELQKRLPALGATLSLPAETPPSAEAVNGMHTLISGMISLFVAPEK